jgi:hypothetical protein
MLYKTKVELELITDMEILDFLKGLNVVGSHSLVVNVTAKANNKVHG